MSTHHPRASRRRLPALALTAALGATGLIPAIAHSQAAVAPIDPALSQVVTADEQVAPVGTPTVIDAGHVDLGVLNGPDFELLARDDTVVPPVWRHLDDVVLHVSDAASQQLPEGDQFAFTGAAPGDRVWVVPQTEVPGVPWLGWNTQSPELISAADRGVTFEFAGHSGPGQFTLFLQNGGFEAPQQLWNSSAEGTQPFWAELNTHTHANWVFTEPGTHQVALRVKIPLNDGTEVSSTQVVTLAIGDGADLTEAQNTEWSAPLRETEDTETAEAAGESSLFSTWWILAAGITVCAIIAVAGVATTRKGGRK
ncbi:choice-of-anchor M domain-containing protein [Corynebacterium sp. LK2510]|uniref:choice-of-anchor M domain-containing protein n=1 Tax=Corynebacterium sp. LK2510 TaxID=3110472 RepID=UPI0034CD0287